MRAHVARGTRFLPFVVVAAGAAACVLPPVDPTGRACDESGACALGFVCVEGACEFACADDEECPGTRRCIEGACLAGIVDPPDAGFVDAGFVDAGDGVADAGGDDEDAGPGDAGFPDAGPATAPEAQAASALVPGEVTSRIGVPAFDLNGDALVVVVVNAPAHGTANGVAPAVPDADDGTVVLEYTPAPGFAGFDSVSVAVEDGGGLRSAPPVEITIEVVGRSCAHVLNAGGSGGDGVYFADITDDAVVNPEPVFCEMTTAGGGWTLALKVDGALDTFCYDAAAWTDTTLINEGSRNFTLEEAKLAPFVALPFDDLLLLVDDLVNPAAPTTSLVVPFADPTIAGLSMQQVFALDRDIDSTLVDNDWRSALFPAQAASIQNGFEGLNIERNDALSAVRIGHAGTVCTFDESTVGVGMRSAGCSGSDFVSAGMRGDSCGGVEFGRAAFARVLLRSRDFRFLPPALSCDEHLANGRILSGRYLVDDAPGGAVPVEQQCDFAGFRRIVAFDVDDGDACPAPLIPNTTGPGCIREGGLGGPVSLFFATGAAPFTQVRGVVEGNAFGQLDSFQPSLAGATINNVYVDGISVTAGDPTRTHVFTLAVADVAGAGRCACNSGTARPAFAGNDHTCDAVNADAAGADLWNTNDPLFDFEAVNFGCVPLGSNTEFTSTIAPNGGPLEVRIMTDQPADDEDLALTRLELFVR